MSLSNESKIRVLENFYAIDYALFGKSSKEMTSCCPAIVEDYINLKGALLSIVTEIYQLVEHAPTPLTEKADTKKLKGMARSSAIIARENCKKLVATEQGRSDIKESLKEAITEDCDIDDVVQEKIREKAFALSVDNLLIARTLTECSDAGVSKLNETSGKLLEDAYKILRDSLVESAVLIVDLEAMGD